MRRLAFALGAAALIGCAKTETPPAEPPAPPPAPPAINLADLAGTWTVVVKGEGSDSTLVTYPMTATASETGWMVTLPNRPPMALQVTASGDSIMTSLGPFESVLRKGVQVTTQGVLRLQDGKLVGPTVAHYKTAVADSVTRLRTEATRTP
jgi:hypothetical protein